MSVAQDDALPRSAHQIELALDDTRAITAPLDRPGLSGTNGENAAHASIFLGTEHVDASLGRAAVRKPVAHEPNMPNVSKFRATKPRIEDADVHDCLRSRLSTRGTISIHRKAISEPRPRGSPALNHAC